jgi:hypothetical protein
MAAWVEQRRVSTPSRWLLALLLLAGALLVAEATRQFAMPGDPTVRDVPLTLPLDRDAQMFTLKNNAPVWLVRQSDGTLVAFAGRSPWYFGPLVRLRSELFGEARPQDGHSWFYDGWNTFDRDGTVRCCPSFRGLDRFEIRQVSPERVVILDGSHVTLGTCIAQAVGSGRCSSGGEFKQQLAQPAQARY